MNKPFPHLIVGIVCLAGGAVIYLPCLLGALYFFLQQTQELQHIAVIGGADGPTAEMMFRMLFGSPVFWITMVGGFVGKTSMIAGLWLTLAGIIERLSSKKA